MQRAHNCRGQALGLHRRVVALAELINVKEAPKGSSAASFRAQMTVCLTFLAL